MNRNSSSFLPQEKKILRSNRSHIFHSGKQTDLKHYRLSKIIGKLANQQARNQGAAQGRENVSPSLENCVGHSSKNLGPLRKLFAPPGVPSLLRACQSVSCHSTQIVPSTYQDQPLAS